MKRELYLEEVLKQEEVEYSSNNLILSPVGSGKTYFMFEDLAKRYGGAILILVSTTFLKEAVKKEEGVVNTKEIKRQGEVKAGDRYVMTYAEFGSKVAWDARDSFLKQFDAIFADEIHSLFQYFSFGGTQVANLAVAISKLFRAYDWMDIYYFTATTALLEEFKEENGDMLFSNTKVIDYREHKDIKRHKQAELREFTNINETLEIIDSLEDFTESGYKGVIYSERISGMKEYEEQLLSRGYKVISLWSINNKKHPMNKEQLKVRKYMVENEKMPDDYDFVIFNGSMREGWNLKDPRVQFVGLNTEKTTDLIQARGRVRGDIMILAVRVEGGKTPLELKFLRRIEQTKSIEKVLDKELDTEGKKALAEEIKLVRENGRLLMWRGIKELLESNGYKVKDKVKRVDGKQKRVSVITREQDNKQES